MNTHFAEYVVEFEIRGRSVPVTVLVEERHGRITAGVPHDPRIPSDLFPAVARAAIAAATEKHSGEGE